MARHRAFYRSSFPAQFAAWPLNGSFSALDSFSMTEDTYTYAARIRHAGSHALPGDPYVRENASAALTAHDFLTYWTYGLFFRGTGDIKVSWLAAQFLFTLAWFLLLHAMLLRLGAGHGQAIFGAAAITLFADLARALGLAGSPLPAFKQAAQYAFWFLGSYEYLVGPTRITGPLMTYAALFGAGLCGAWSAEKRDKLSPVLAGLATGALAYVHADVWSVALGAAVLHAALAKGRPRVVAVALIAAAVSAPFVLMGGHGAHAELLGWRAGRAVELWSVTALFGAWLAWRSSSKTPMGLWLAGALLSVFIARNSSLITGGSLGLYNWAYIGNVLLAVAAVRALRAGHDERYLWAAGLVCALALPRAVSFAAQHHQVHGLPATQEQAFKWLEANTKPDSVVAALSPWTGLTLPVHSHNKTVSSFICRHVSDVSPAENAQRMDYALSLFGVKREKYWSYVRQPSDWGDKLWNGVVDVDGRERGMWVAHFCNLPEEKVGALLEQAARERKGKTFPVEYLWLGRFERALGAKPPKSAKPVFNNADVTLYAL